MSGGSRASLLQYYAALRRHGLNDSHSGNASVRDGDTVWITPSGAPAEGLAESALVACRLPDKVGDGASLDAPLHLAVYRADPGIGAVLHAHSPHTVAMTLGGAPFEPLDQEGMLYFPGVPLVSPDGGDYWEWHRARAPERVAAALVEHRACVLRGHGVYASGESLDRAYQWLCALEHSAKIAWLAASGKGTGG